MTLSVVVTTIQEPTPSLRALHGRVVEAGGHLVVAGDKKGPVRFDLSIQSTFLSLQSQLASPFSLAGLLPVNHYGRKNIGYLHAIRSGASLIYETDDDNAPNERWQVRERETEARQVQASGWVNAYRYFTADRIWPRGLPLDAIGRWEDAMPSTSSASRVASPIQQGLADGSPDVDALWRLTMDRAFTFDFRPSILLPPGAWCPFNSQSTWWWPEAYPFMYLPSYCSFRMTDIWRSFIAQRCLWELDCGVVFHAAEVVQERNPHNLMRDFEDEVPGYLRNREIATILEGLSLRPGPGEVGSNLVRCYEALVVADVFPPGEMILVRAWLDDLAAIGA